MPNWSTLLPIHLSANISWVHLQEQFSTQAQKGLRRPQTVATQTDPSCFVRDTFFIFERTSEALCGLEDGTKRSLSLASNFILGYDIPMPFWAAETFFAMEGGHLNAYTFSIDPFSLALFHVQWFFFHGRFDISQNENWNYNEIQLVENRDSTNLTLTRVTFFLS